MPDIYEELGAWLKSRPRWQQDAAGRILRKGSLSDEDVAELVADIKKEDGRMATDSIRLPGFVRAAPTGGGLRLESIGPVAGIENLAPRKPLAFGPENLAVVFGLNGSGKSGYIRILKNICGKPLAAELRTNVFADPPSTRSCGIAYSEEGKRKETDWVKVEWAPGKPVEKLRSIDVFDGDCGRQYVSKESEASYSPPAVTLLEQLAGACDSVKARLQQEAESLVCALPLLPAEYQSTDVGKAYNSLRAGQEEPVIQASFGWSDAHRDALAFEEERLQIADPAQLARTKLARVAQLNALLTKLREAGEAVAPRRVRRIDELKSEAAQKRRIAQQGAEATASSSVLSGIGSDTWREMWEAARRYSTFEVYRDKPFPFTGDGSKCVLCQQPLGADSQQRLKAFEGYVSGVLEAAATSAERTRDACLEVLPASPEDSSLEMACVAGGILADTWVPRLKRAWSKIAAACGGLRTLPAGTPSPVIDLDVDRDFAELRALSEESQKQAKQHEADAAAFDRAAAKRRCSELRARQWTSQQLATIRSEVARLAKVVRLKELESLASSGVFSRKASEVAQTLVTSEYVSRFNEELKALGAFRLRVELVRTRALHGKVMHRVALKGAKQNIGVVDILSEGERRVVELAAFLADLTGKPTCAPFVFDDPISSLDQEFEERTADRLLLLAKTRQVLVFTHRLSLFGLLAKGSPATVEQIGLQVRQESWGAGEPGAVSLFARNPEKALKELKNCRLAQAKKVFEKEGKEAYYPLAKAICSDVRILTERLVEKVLLNGVVERHIRDVKTKGLLQGLTRIESRDCRLIDAVMTKYSSYEHSQSDEAPVEVPSPGELAADIENLLTWHADFSSRQVIEGVGQGDERTDRTTAPSQPRPVVIVK